MYLQNNQGLLPDIQRVGCLYLSMLRIYELLSEEDIALENVNLIWRLSKQRNYVDGKNNMKQMDSVFRLAKQTCGFPKLAFSVGLIENQKETYWEWTKSDSDLHSYKFMIENLKTYGIEGNHFVLCDKTKELLFDSYSFKPYKYEHIGRYHLINNY